MKRDKPFPILTVFERLTPVIESLDAPIVDFIATQTGDPYRILIATILSARTTDQITTRVVKKLFPVASNLDEMAELTVGQLEELIYPVGFYRQKAKQLKELPQVLAEKFGGEIPKEIDELIQLPGVGRKTANLVRTVAFKLPAICVDTHVHRITNRWGYVKTASPLATEMKLREILPQELWLNINHYLVSLGQKICRPQRPQCWNCVLADICPKLGVKKTA